MTLVKRYEYIVTEGDAIVLKTDNDDEAQAKFHQLKFESKTPDDVHIWYMAQTVMRVYQKDVWEADNGNK